MTILRAVRRLLNKLGLVWYCSATPSLGGHWTLRRYNKGWVDRVTNIWYCSKCKPDQRVISEQVIMMGLKRDWWKV